MNLSPGPKPSSPAQARASTLPFDDPDVFRSDPGRGRSDAAATGSETRMKGSWHVELNGTNVIPRSQRRGRPRDLFWLWTAATISVMGMSYGGFALSLGISAAQAVAVSVIGVVVSGLISGLVAVGGKRGSAPTLVLSRAAFGVLGNRVPAAVSWVLCLGWEVVATTAAALATATVFRQLGWHSGSLTTATALAVVVALVVGGAVLGFGTVMRMQRWISGISIALTVVYVALVLPDIDLGAVSALPAGGLPALIGATVFIMVGSGLGWADSAADYSRYLPRTASGAAVAVWTALGMSLVPLLLVIFGVVLAGSDPALLSGLRDDPVGALAELLPVWFLVPFVLVTVLSLTSSALLDIYSSGLTLLALGVPISRARAAGLDGVLTILASVYVLFIATGGFFVHFQGFIISLGVPMAAWTGIFLADMALRSSDYDDVDLFDPLGRYGSIRVLTLTIFGVCSLAGWGLVTNSVAPLAWQGFLLGPLGGKDGEWASANLGVLVALGLGFVSYAVLARPVVAHQEAPPERIHA